MQACSVHTQAVHKLTNRTSAGETSSLESMTAGGWLLGGSLATGLETPLRDATCDLVEENTQTSERNEKVKGVRYISV